MVHPYYRLRHLIVFFLDNSQTNISKYKKPNQHFNANKPYVMTLIFFGDPIFYTILTICKCSHVSDGFTLSHTLPHISVQSDSKTKRKKTNLLQVKRPLILDTQATVTVQCCSETSHVFNIFLWKKGVVKLQSYSDRHEVQNIFM